jgi:opacity protein-like surface antigen
MNLTMPTENIVSMNITKIKNIFSAFIFIFSFYASAGIIKQVKNEKVLMTLDDSNAQIGDQFYAVNAANKKTALLELTTVKNNQAVAKIIKGTAAVNDTTEAKKSGGASSGTASNAATAKPTFIRHDLKKMALNLKINSDIISTKQKDNTQTFPNEETVDMVGTNLGLNLTLDLPVNNWFDLRGFAGYEMLKVKGTSKFLSCDGRLSTDCNATINYLTGGGLLRFKYVSSNFEFWSGLGLGFKQPLSKKSTALTEDNIAMATTLIVGLGLDYFLSNKYFIPASFEYHKSFNESETVPKILTTALSIGFGKMF